MAHANVIEDKNGNTLVKLFDVQLCWPFLGSKKNELADKYTVDICHLDKEHIKALKAAGLANLVRTEDEDKLQEKEEKAEKEIFNRETFITAKSGERYFRILYPNKRLLSVEEADKIGNGTVANVVINPFEYTFKGKKGVGCGLKVIVIKDLVEFEGGGDITDSEDMSDLFEEDTELDDEIPF